jgi:PAS domain S-box-containing protein
MSRYFSKSAVIGFLLILVLLLAAVGSALRSQAREASALLWVRHTDLVLANLKEMRTGLTDAEASAIQYQGTYSPSTGQQFDLDSTNLNAGMMEVAELTIDNHIQQCRLPALRSDVGDALASMRLTMQPPTNPGLSYDQRLSTVIQISNASNNTRQMIHLMESEELRLLRHRILVAQRQLRIEKLIDTTLAVLGVGLLCLSSGLVVFYRRKQAKSDEAWSDSERRFEGMVANLPGVVYRALRRRDGSVERQFVSEGSRVLFGVTPDEFREDRLTMERLVHPDDKADFMAHVKHVNDKVLPWRWQGRFLIPSGPVKTIQCSGHPSLQDDGSIIWDCMLMDVTGRMQAEQKAAQLMAIVESSDDAIYGRTLNGIVTTWNPAAERMYGYTAEEMIGYSMAQMVPDDRQNEIDHIFERIAVGERVLSYETVRRTKGGDLIEVTLSISPIRDKDGVVIGASTIAQDISEENRAEARLRRSESAMADAQAATHIGSWELDIATQTITSSDEMKRLYGFDLEHPPIELADYFNRFRPDEREESVEAIEDAIRLRQPYETDRSILLPDGSTRILHTLAKPVVNELGEVTKMVGTATDVTERRRAEEERRRYLSGLEEARDAAQTSTRAKSEFLANMSHEIRTPMNGVIGMAGLLLDTNLSEEQRDYAETIRASGDTLLTIINDILDLSKVEAGKMLVEISEFNLSDALKDVAELMSGMASAKGLEIVIVLPAGMPRHVRGDAGRIRQILTNFVSNAVKFTDDGTVTLSVELIAESAIDTTIRFNVVDTGIGIAPEQQEPIFESFIQADGSTTRKYGGTGLGLTISRQLISLMGGRIGVSSTVGAGSCFWAELTLQKHEIHRPVQEPSALSVPTQPAALGFRVLIAEDNSTNQKLALRLLHKWGCHADAVANGREALDALAVVPYDLVLMDMQMPEMDGLEAATEVRVRERISGHHIPIIAMTANAMESDRQLCLLSGMDDYISKPIKAQELYAKIAAHSTGLTNPTGARAA